MTYIYLDWDTPFSLFYNSESRQAWLIRTLEKMNHIPDEIVARESCGGNTHIRIRFNDEMGTYIQLMVRAILLDDPKRIRADLERVYFGKCDRVGKIFSEKMNLITGVKQVSGAWVNLKYIPEQFNNIQI